MKKLLKKYFKESDFTDEQIVNISNNCKNDLEIAEESKRVEVKFIFSYNALIKICIIILHIKKGFRIRSIPGHHIKLLEAISLILQNDDIYDTGNAMRMKRKANMYETGLPLSKMETEDYFQFVLELFNKTKEIVKKKSGSDL